MSQTIGYARVSTTDQNPESQEAKLREAGAQRIFVDHGQSSRRRDRPQWLECLAYMREGDTLLVVSLDRLAGTQALAIETINDLGERGISIKSLTEPEIDTTTPMGRAMLGIVAVFAQLRVDSIRANTMRRRQPRHHHGRRHAHGRPPRRAHRRGAADRSLRMTARIRLTDTTLRDGSHPMSHRFSVEQVRTVVRALDGAGVEVIEVTHGDGLGGSSFNYGFSATNELELVKAAVETAERARIAVLMLPGLGTIHDLEAAHGVGAQLVRIATHSTEADISIQHFGRARELGMETAGFLMLAHRTSPEELAKQARIMADAGCQCVYVVDSAGALILEEVTDRVAAVVAELGDDAQVGFHGHQNLSLGIANSVLAVRAGAQQIDGTLGALGAGAGNSPTEVLVPVFDRLGIETGVDAQAVMAAAEDIVRPMMLRVPIMDRASIMQGYAGVYSSFLLHAERAAERYGVPAHRILEEIGKAGYVGGQEDMIVDVAVQLQQAG